MSPLLRTSDRSVSRGRWQIDAQPARDGDVRVSRSREMKKKGPILRERYNTRMYSGFLEGFNSSLAMY